MIQLHDLPEPLQLLLAAARTPRTPHATARADAAVRARCTPSQNWPEFLSLAAHHRLSSLALVGLLRAAPPGLPLHVLATLRHRAMENACRALGISTESSRLTQALATAGAPAAVLKGVPLSQLLYGSPHARHVGDLDLLIRPTGTRAPAGKGLSPQLEALQHLGYTRINPPGDLTPRRQRAYLRFWKDMTFRSPDQTLDLDLHWRLFNLRINPANAILAGARFTSITVFDAPMRVLSLEDQFLFTAAHGASDAWIYLKSLADLAAFLTLLTPAALDHALERARSLGLLPQLAAGMALANAWMDTGIPPPELPARNSLPAHLHQATADLLARHYARPLRDDRTPAEWLALERRLVPGLRARAEMALRFLWRPRVWLAFQLPDRLFWLCPLLGLLLLPRPASLWRSRRTRLHPAEATIQP